VGCRPAVYRTGRARLRRSGPACSDFPQRGTSIILTFFLVNAIYNTAVSGKAGNFAGLAIGLTLAFCILMGGPLTGASLNPARTLGPALVSGSTSDLWLYFVGPIIGGLLAALLYRGGLQPAED